MSPTPDSRRSAIAEEQAFLDTATALRGRMIARLADGMAEAEEDGDRALHRVLRRQHDELLLASDRLVFGRLDGLDGSVWHVGRVGVREEDVRAEPLVLDWRAPAARPFYTATPVDPQGQARRRHIRTEGAAVVGVEDEPLDGSSASDLVGEGALLAALGERRTGRMSTAVSTLQREQDEVVRAEASGPLIVQGGPGTGKTVVALHRVAYLLFTHQQVADRAVLVLGPSPRFLDYIAQVLPALGETAVVSATCDTLVPGAVVARAEDRVVSEIKGRAAWQRALEERVAALRPRPRDLELRWDGESHVVDRAVVAQLLASVRARPHHPARAAFAEQLHQVLAELIAEHREAALAEVEEGFEDVLARVDRSLGGTVHDGPATGSDVDGRLSEEEVDELRAAIAGHPTIARFVEHWWPTLDAGAVLRGFLADPVLLGGFLPPEEVALVVAEPEALAPGDIPLLDAVADLLGDVDPPRGQAESVADRARARRGWTYGHVVVDEAQELSEMQWHMVLRRCPARSITAVGDIDQAEASHRHTSWAQAVRATLGDNWTTAELTICYRTPSEVMSLTAPVLEKAGSRNTPPRAVRSSGVTPWERSTTPADLPGAAREAVAGLRERWRGGTVGVVAARAHVAPLKALLDDDIPVLTATEAKGLEWDATLVVDPEGISAEPRGWNGLYVALTRCTQELGQLRVA
ncbi:MULTISPECIES: UvrD-helicase domain-containing protein [Actinosynnema]|uniref:HelD family protein n=1 Tax=Actinosynnema TaxID=40566 RepID=UPI0020A51378|nr:UvrD-helicase domain-containing protein [Actinosynnema pretiosum]MCP2094371.1 DNA helicase IV [Actinosynnema pretiosum]